MTIQGTPDPDILNGTEGTDIFFPLLGDDLVFGGGGNDEIHARDSLTPAGVSEGDDSFYGQSGNDLLNASGGLGRHLLDGGDGLDTLYGGLGNDLLTGGSGDDELWDQVSGTDTLLGGAGNDHLSTYTSLGNDSLDGGSGDDTLEGGTGDDTLLGGEGADSLTGDAGNDRLSGGLGNDFLFGGAGNDTLLADAGQDTLYGGEGDDNYQLFRREFFLYDTAGSDSAAVGLSFVKLPASIESVSYTHGALALPYWLDALLPGGAAGFRMLLGPASTLAFNFASTLPTSADAQDALGFAEFTPAQKVFTREALAYVASVVDLHFLETQVSDALNTISFANNRQVNSAGYASEPGAASDASDVFLDVDTPGNLAPADGDYSALTLIHEIGHALGLKHPFSQTDALGGLSEGPYLSAFDDNTAWTVMSYNDSAAQYHLQYSALDLAALHYLYGPSASARPADDTYALDTGAPNFVWDGGGLDTLDASSITLPVSLYLEPGYWGYVGVQAATITGAGQVTINFGTVIEGLKGGTGADLLVGNGANNTITGGPGNDTIDGGAGDDEARFSGVQANYTITPTLTGYRVQDNVGTDGTDTLTQIERLVFAPAPVTPVNQSVNLVAYTWKNHTLLADVSVSNSSLDLVTASDGATSFEAIPGQALTLTASRPVRAAEASLTSSAVNLQDAIAILKMIVGLDVNGASKPLSPYQALAADFDGNGVVQLTDAIGVLKHVVGLTAPQPAWHFVNELDTSVPGKANLSPGQPQTSISANTSGSSPVHVGLVGYLSGDVDGSFAGVAGALDLDALQSGYFTSLAAASGLNLTQFGVYGV